MGRVARFLLLSAFLLAGWATSAAADRVTLAVGVRADAPPFSYKLADDEMPAPGRFPDGPLRVKRFAGYVVNICDQVLFQLKAMSPDLTVDVQVVDASNRFSRLEHQSGAGTPIDILCDPTTITDDRLYRFLASPPIYLSGITFASQPTMPPDPPCASIVGVVDETTAALTGVQQILAGGNWGVYAPRIRAALGGGPPPAAAGAPACNSLNDNREQQQPILYKGTHDELAAAFCNKEVLYYVGDIEIVNRKLSSIPDCAFTDGALTYTDERYAILARVPTPEDGAKARYLLKFFEILSREILSQNSIMMDAFQAAFPGYTASPKLQALYWGLIGTFPGAER